MDQEPARPPPRRGDTLSEDAPARVVRRLIGEAPRAVHGDGRTASRVELADGRLAVLKSAHQQPGQVAAEVAGLRWLAEPGAIPVPEVLGHDADWLLLEYLPAAQPNRSAATRFGRDLAGTHAAGAAAFGAGPPGGPTQAWIGRAPMVNVTGADWPDWYVEHRVLPYLRMARDGGGLTAEQASVIEAACQVLPSVAGPPVRPARLHGDLWSGNVCWSLAHTEQVAGWLIDPAAHGGHPETDLAMLALFGCPHRDAVLAGYQEISPLAEGWPDRIALHQLFPLLVHVVLFGAGYAGQAVAAARSTQRLANGIP